MFKKRDEKKGGSPFGGGGSPGTGGGKKVVPPPIDDVVKRIDDAQANARPDQDDGGTKSILDALKDSCGCW